MKKLMFAIGLGLISGSVYAACLGGDALCYGDGKVTINSLLYVDGNGVMGVKKTVAQINASTATYAGQKVICTDCTVAYNTCISTSTAAPGAGSDYILSTGTICK